MPYRAFLIVSIVMAVFQSVLALLLPVLTGDAVDLLLGRGLTDWDSLKVIMTEMIMVTLGQAVCSFLMNTCNNHLTYSTVRDIRKDAMKHIGKLPLSYLDRHPAGELVSRMVADVDQFADGLLMGFTQFFTAVVTIAGTLILMITISPLITAVVVLLTPLSFTVASFIAKRTYRYFKEQSEVRGKQTAIINEMLSQEKTVKAFAYEKRALERFDENNKKLSSVSLQAIFASSLTNPSTRFVNNMVYAAVAFAGSAAVIRGRFTVGKLTAFLSYSTQYTKPFNEISGVVTELQNAIACAERIFELIDAPEETSDNDAMEIDTAEGAVNIEHMSFSYSKEKKLLEDVNINVKPGEHIAIVGPTGCGKTTLINLLMRFYDPDEGFIRLDGTPTTGIKRSSLRRNIGMVLQDTYLKPGTIRDNILMGKNGASEEEMIEAAKKAHSHSFIKQLSEGYDTVIGEDGGMLSQGQKQLICITRLMLALPPMLILDEATSSIDTRTEMRIQKAFGSMMEGRTSFIVAHRLSTIKEADCILVMKDGNIIEQGRHDDLLKHDGFYSRLYKSQFEV
ncbi:MAG: ABC transporter ATP-binding protein/permease [Lachnospiraceae bacterium]|nr:ABC transporter ATP-binding protein/permease [Lachnospiraceae bacterium]